MGLPQAADQVGDDLLKVNAVPAGLGISQSGADALHSVVGSQSQSVAQGLAPHQSTHAGGSKHITSAVDGYGQALIKVAAVLAGLLVVVHNAQLFRLKADTRQGHIPGTQLGQCLEHLADICFVVLRAIGQAGEQAGFGEVGDDHVRLGAYLGHLSGEIGAEGRVELTVVRHGRVDQNQVVRSFEGVKEGAHIAHLLFGGQVAGVDGVELEPLLLPVVGNGVDLVGEILTSEIFKHGVGREYRGGEDGTFYSHGGDNGQSHCQGALTQAGDVLYADDPFHGVHFLCLILSALYQNN